MSVVAWLTQCSGGIAFLLVLGLSIWVLTKEVGPAAVAADYRPLIAGLGGRGFWTIVFAYYCLAIHVNVICFSTRSCYGIWDMTFHLRDDAEKAKMAVVHGLGSSLQRPPSAASLSSSETLTSSNASSSSSSPTSSTSSDAGDFDLEKCSGDTTPVTDTVVHAIIIPNYKEEIDTLTETLDVLASHPQARECYDVRFRVSSSPCPLLPTPPPLSISLGRPPLTPTMRARARITPLALSHVIASTPDDTNY
jgi:hypothetical protein